LRLGGDEFLLIFPQYGSKQANIKIKEIEARLAKIELNEGIPFVLGFSYGIAVYQADLFDSAEEYIAYSDKLMYQNKLEKNGAV
jgi:GGDEF domain-containing protein